MRCRRSYTGRQPPTTGATDATGTMIDEGPSPHRLNELLAKTTRAAYAEAIRKLGPMLGADFSGLNESQMCDDFHYTIFPNVTFNTHSLFVWVFSHRPHPDDPNKMIFEFWDLLND